MCIMSGWSAACTRHRARTTVCVVMSGRKVGFARQEPQCDGVSSRLKISGFARVNKCTGLRHQLGVGHQDPSAHCHCRP
jgi:hypothetical protein